LKTAKALGINVAVAALGRADEVIRMKPPSSSRW